MLRPLSARSRGASCCVGKASSGTNRGTVGRLKFFRASRSDRRFPAFLTTTMIDRRHLVRYRRTAITTEDGYNVLMGRPQSHEHTFDEDLVA